MDEAHPIPEHSGVHHNEVAGAQFAQRFAARLRDARHRRHRPIVWLAARGHGRYSSRDLRDAEHGLLPLDATTVGELAEIYGVDLHEVISSSLRSDLVIHDDMVSAGGVSVPFEAGNAASLVAAYFRLARTLRSIPADDPAPVVPRRGDVEAIMAHVIEAVPTDELIERVLILADGDRLVAAAATRNAMACAGIIDEEQTPR